MALLFLLSPRSSALEEEEVKSGSRWVRREEEEDNFFWKCFFSLQGAEEKKAIFLIPF